MTESAFQFAKYNPRGNANDWLHAIPIVSYGRIIKVIDIQTVVVESVVRSSMSIEVYAITLLSLSSSLLEISDYPKQGDTVLLLFLQKHDPLMFAQETVENTDATGYNKFSGVGVLMSTAKNAAATVVSAYEKDDKSILEVSSSAAVSGRFNNQITLAFLRAMFDSEDEQLITMLFGAGRPLVMEHLARVEREHGFWKDPDNELIQMDASVTERYSVYAPVTKDIQGAQKTDIGLGADKDDAPVETEAPVSETIHGKSPVTRDIRAPQNITIGIGNAETEDAGEQRDAPVNITAGEKADITLSSKSALTMRFEKAVLLETDESYELSITGAITLSSEDAVNVKAAGAVNIEADGDVAVKGSNVTIDAASSCTLKTGDAASWMPNIMPVCPLGPVHGGTGAGIAKLKGG